MNISLLRSGGAGGDSRDTHTTQKYPLGEIAIGGDRSIYRYAKVGSGAALVAGNCIQGPAIVTTHLALVAAAAPIGSTQVTLTLGGTNNAAANQYAEGWIVVDTTPGNGRRYRIASHPAIALSTAGVFTLYPDDPIAEVAWTTATRAGLIANPYNGVIQMPATTATGLLVGVAVVAAAASSFCWLQTAGMGNPLNTGGTALGQMVISPSAVAGAVETSTATTLLTGQVVGRTVQIGVTLKNNAVQLTIDQS